MQRYWVYDFKTAPVQRMIDAAHDERLEHYSFEKHGPGRFALEVQSGWPGGAGHYDGAGNSFPLPKEWFQLSWEEFLDKLMEKYPKKLYGYGKDELLPMDGLRRFLGFR